jgi:hypothetical protein
MARLLHLMHPATASGGRRKESAMTRTIIATCGALALAGLTASAQSPRPQSQSQAPMSGGETVTITGCVNEWDSTLGMKRSDVASPQTASAPRQFILTSRSGDDGTTYMLEGTTANLRAHINHTVEITGTARPADRSSADDSDSPSLDLAILTVQNVKMVSASCR